MRAPRHPEDEAFRTLALDGLGILDTGPEPDFDAIVGLGRDLFGVPICLISLIDRDRQWFKARVGLEASEAERSTSFCGHAILEGAVMVVPDARQDERFHDNPFVTGAPHIRFYAGAPIVLPSGYPIGTVCLVSPEPRADFGAEEAARLSVLAKLAVDALAVRALRRQLDRERAEREQLRRAVELLDRPLLVTDRDGVVLEVNSAFASLAPGYVAPGMSALEATGLTREDLERSEVSPEGSRREEGGRILRVHADPAGYVVTLEPSAE